MAQKQDEQVSPEEEPVKEPEEEPVKKPEEEPVKKTWKRKKESSKKKKAVKTAKRARKLSSLEDGGTTPSPDPVASGSEAASEQTAAEEDPSRPKSPLPFHDEGLEDAPGDAGSRD